MAVWTRRHSGDLLFQFPRSLPVAAIDAAYSDPVPFCRELSAPAGYVDALYINALGRLILAEFKLWRNPQARREVIGQILDYTKGARIVELRGSAARSVESARAQRQCPLRTGPRADARRRRSGVRGQRQSAPENAVSSCC